MKLVTSTGDFSWYADDVEGKIRNFKGTKFKYINLEQSGSTRELFSEDENEWKKVAERWGNAAADAGVKFVVSHAPCVNAFKNFDEEAYRVNLRAVRRSVEICNVLGIDRIVVHSCNNDSFGLAEFLEHNKKYYSDLFDLMEKYNITVMTENWDSTQIPGSTGKELCEIVEYIDHPLLGVCWDTAHGNINTKARETGQYENIMAIGDKLKGLHISDNLGGSFHHHSWPFSGIINFDSVMQGLIDAKYDGYFTLEASYTLLHHKNPPVGREPWEHNGEMVTRLLDPSLDLKKQAVDLLYETSKYILESYNCFEE